MIRFLKIIPLTFSVIILFGNTLSSHHLRGIPHYSYRDNYPETPIYEVFETEDQYHIIFTYYNIPGQNALDLAIYIKDTVTSEPFEAPVSFMVFGEHEDPTRSHTLTAYRNPTNIYKVGWVYEDDGNYYVRITFADSAKTHNVLFDLRVGERGGVWLYLGGALILIFAFMVITAIVKKKRADVRCNR